jgi:hypothetical protein
MSKWSGFGGNCLAIFFSWGALLRSDRTSVKRDEKELRRLLPYWARELLEIWEEAEAKNRVRGPSLQEVP